MSKCKHFCDQLSDYIDGEIGRNECVLIEEHLDVCPPCNLLYESLRTTLQMCSQGVSDEMPPDVQARLKGFLREHCAQIRSEGERGGSTHG